MIKPLKNPAKLYPTICYSIVGLSNNLLIYMIYLLMTFEGINPKLTIKILYPIAILTAFISHSKYSFKYQGKLKKVMGRYLSCYFICYCINYTILFIFIDEYKLPHQMVQAFSIFFIGGILFFMLKYFVSVIPEPLKES
ncbi:MAG: GtrA family protein [Legionella sp.]|nr:GtrA family protein [Legionella sp.]